MIIVLPSLCVEYRFSLLKNRQFIWFTIRFIYYFDKSIKDCFTFFIFQRINPSIFCKTSITHNKYLTFSFLKDNDPIAAKSAAQILPLNLAQTPLLLSFLVTGLCHYSAGFSLDSLLFCLSLSLLILFSYQKAYRPCFLMLFDIRHF